MDTPETPRRRRRVPDREVKCIDLVDSDDDSSRSSFDSFMFCKSPKKINCGTFVETSHHEIPPSMSVCDADYATPRIKTAGNNNAAARRRLSFSPNVQNNCEMWNAPVPTVAVMAPTVPVPVLTHDISAIQTGCNASTAALNQSFEAIMKEILMSQETPHVGQSVYEVLPPLPPAIPATIPLPTVPMSSSSASIKEGQHNTQNEKGLGKESKSLPFIKQPPLQGVQPQITLSTAPAISTVPPLNEKVPDGSQPRRIAQLVVWTKKSGNKLNKNPPAVKKPEIPKVLPPLPTPKSTAPATLPVITSSAFLVPKGKENENARPLKEIVQKEIPKKLESQGDLFFVHYPVRPLTEISKNKGKIQKRSRKFSPSSSSPQKEIKKKCRKQKKSSSILAQGASSGRAYRTYLHSCLEKQRQQLRTDTDYKVEKLFHPDQGVALPGEILPAVNEPEPATCPLTTSTGQLSESIGESFLASQVASNTLEESAVANSHSFTIVQPAELQFTTKSDASDSTQKVLIKDFEENCASSSYQPDINLNNKAPTTEDKKGSTTANSFDLPDSFTVSTTASLNEFDLLIQNVIHEEMVGQMGEEDFVEMENSRKKMKMDSSSSSRTSSEEKLSIEIEPGKPRCTYTELIEKALTETGGLTVSEIYNWISERYPFFKPDDDRWKNSVRHNLSINPYFKKGEKARNGAGHLWTISEESKSLRPSMRRKNPADTLEFEMPMESETDRAVANILGKYISECRANQEASKREQQREESSSSSVAVNNAKNQSFVETNTPSAVMSNQPVESHHQQQSPHLITDLGESQKINEHAQIPNGATCNLDEQAQPSELATFNLNELNSGQFTVDLTSIEFGNDSCNVEELITTGRLIYIQSDADANKENVGSGQTVLLNESMLSELSTLTNNGNQEENRFQTFYSDPMSFELGISKGSSSIPSTSHDSTQINISTAATSAYNCNIFHQDTLVATTGCSQMVLASEPSSESHPRSTDLTTLDQVISMPSPYDVSLTSSIPGSVSTSLPVISSAALFESKELGVSYIYQTEQSGHDLLQ